MPQIKNKIENRQTSWAAYKRFRIGDTCTHNGTEFINVTGKNIEPGTTNDWLSLASAIEILDLLTSTDADKALSANQGRVLKNLIDGNTAKFADYILLTEKGAANGVAILDSNGKIVSSQYGDLAVTDTITATETDLTTFVTNNANYTFQQGDIIVLAADGDGNIAHYLFKGGDKSLESSYSKLNATKIPISAVIGLQAALDGKYSKAGEYALKTKDFTDQADSYMQLTYFASENRIRFETVVGGVSNDQFNLALFRNGSYKRVLLEGEAAGTKPKKTIPNSTQYTAVLEDKNFFLVFTNPIDFIIPSGIFSADDEISCRNQAAGDVTVVDGSGMTVQVVSSQSKTAPQYAFFGLRFETSSVAGLLGQLKPI